jgi:hypothetical protein
MSVANSRPPPVITLTTDFGLRDHYVGAVKGAILSVNPAALIVDISHEVAAQAIEEAAFLLACAFPFFPPGSIHVAVVDPGVGTERVALALATREGIFIGPDNGILSAALPKRARDAATSGPREVPLAAEIHAFALRETRYHRQPVSRTFHARDIFAPVAAHISLGVKLPELGPEVDSIISLPPFRAKIAEDGHLEGRVLHVDRFGNVITSAGADQVPSGDMIAEIRGHFIRGPVGTYADAGGPSVLIGSSGFLEIALPDGSAARQLGVQLGDQVIVRRP